MAGNRATLEEAAVREESQTNFARSLVELLKQHRAVLSTLPEMFESIIDIASNETSDTQNSDLSREDEQADLLRHYNKKLTEKDERIMQLERELREKTLELEKLSGEEEEKIASWKNNYRNIQEQLKKSNDDLTQQVRAKEDQVKKYEANFIKLTEECNVRLESKEKELMDMKTSNEDLTQQIHTKNEQLNQQEARYNDLRKECKVLLANKDEELRKMKTRLAYLSEKQVQKDQRKVEDTAASNRPSEVEKDFSAFFDEDRLDACEKMQKIYGSEEKSDVGISYPRLACMIFETAYEEMKKIKEVVLGLFKVLIKNMIYSAPIVGEEYASRAKSGPLPDNITFSVIPCRPELEYPIDAFDALVLSLKETAHNCDLDSLEQGVSRKTMDKWSQWLTKEGSCKFTLSDQLLTELSDYIKACIRLTWRMVTQVPPMQLEYQSSTLKDIQKNLGYHSSPEMCSRRPTTEGQTSDEELDIACYLWPALLDGGGKLIRAGEVLCKVKEEIAMV